MLYRKIEAVIESHLKANSKKILLIDGARQVGKTYIIRHVGQKLFENFIEINMVEDSLGDRLFANTKSVEDFYLQNLIAIKLLKQRDLIIILHFYLIRQTTLISASLSLSIGFLSIFIISHKEKIIQVFSLFLSKKDSPKTVYWISHYICVLPLPPSCFTITVTELRYKQVVILLPCLSDNFKFIPLSRFI